MRVHFQVVEGNRKRTQVFEGIVLKRQGSGARETFTVRKNSFGVGVERTFPLHSPKIEKLEVAARGDVRRAKLYYLREKVGKRARVAERRWGIEDDMVIAEEEAEAVDAEGVAVEEAEPEVVEPEEEAEGEEQAEGEAGERARPGMSSRPRASPRIRAEAGDAASGRAGSRAGWRGRAGQGQGLLKVPRPQTTQGAFAELVIIVALALGLALGIQAFIVKPYQIPSESMEPTLDVGQRVLVNRFLYRLRRPGDRRHHRLPPAGGAPRTARSAGSPQADGQPCPEPTPEQADVNFIKRIVAGPGDTLRIEDGHPVVNGVVADEDFIRNCSPGSECNLPQEITIPPDHYFMMGDNRGESDDSRFWGPIPRDWIIGKAFATYWPPEPSRNLLGPAEPKRRKRPHRRQALPLRPLLRRPLRRRRRRGRPGLAGGPAGRRRRPARPRGHGPLASAARSPGSTTPSRRAREEREELYPACAPRRRLRLGRRALGARDRRPRAPRLQPGRPRATACAAVSRDGAVLLVDGFRLPACELEHTAVVDGDARSAAIAAASVIAKVTRDRYMHRADRVYPGWDFAGNVGYSTPEHREAILANGISPLHRRSFASVAYSQLELAEGTYTERRAA